MDAGEPLEGRVRDVTQAGDAVVETAEGIVFARGALPDERVRVQPIQRARGVWHGKLLAVLEPSPARVAAPCPLVERCGGCPLMTLDDAAERSWKRARLARVLGRSGAAIQPELHAGPGSLGYRTRARLAFVREDGQPRLGYRAAASRAIVDVERCLVLAPALDQGLRALRERLAPLLQGNAEIVLASGAHDHAVIAISAHAPQPRALYDAASALAGQAGVAGVSVHVDDHGRTSSSSFGDTDQYASRPDAMELRAPVDVFAQGNADVNRELVRTVAELVEPADKRVLELYAGHGNLTLALTSAAQLTAVESDSEAVTALRRALRERKLDHVTVRCADAAEGARGRTPLDAVVLDPPRTGARDAIAALLLREPAAPARIVYVSCDLATLERDLRTLVDAGYRIDRAHAFDMFPQTAHLESAVRLERVNR